MPRGSLDVKGYFALPCGEPLCIECGEGDPKLRGFVELHEVAALWREWDGRCEWCGRLVLDVYRWRQQLAKEREQGIRRCGCGEKLPPDHPPNDGLCAACRWDMEIDNRARELFECEPGHDEGRSRGMNVWEHWKYRLQAIDEDLARAREERRRRDASTRHGDDT